MIEQDKGDEKVKETGEERGVRKEKELKADQYFS